MNYLAHLLLSGPEDDLRLGGLIGDFMRGSSIDSFGPGVRRGIFLHNEIDRLTDAHPVFRRSRARLPERFRRYSGVIVDVGYDHFLAASFQSWHPSQTLAEFAQEAYALLEARRDELPPRLQEALPWFVGEDWLSAYADFPHLERVFQGMSRRARRDNPLGEAPAALAACHEELAGDFSEFFADLRVATAEARSRVGAGPDPGTLGS